MGRYLKFTASGAFSENRVSPCSPKDVIQSIQELYENLPNGERFVGPLRIR